MLSNAFLFLSWFFSIPPIFPVLRSLLCVLLLFLLDIFFILYIPIIPFFFSFSRSFRSAERKDEETHLRKENVASVRISRRRLIHLAISLADPKQSSGRLQPIDFSLRPPPSIIVFRLKSLVRRVPKKKERKSVLIRIMQKARIHHPIS